MRAAMARWMVPALAGLLLAGCNAPESTRTHFGAATRANLAAMVAAPADLAHGAQSGAADGVFAARGVAAYRAAGMVNSLPAAEGNSAAGGKGGS